MSMDYQNRRDIDRIYTDLYSIDTLKAVTYKDGSENTGRPLDDVIDDLRSEFTPLRTEWRDVEFLDDDFTHYSDTVRLQYRIIGNIVELDGSWKPLYYQSASDEYIPFASIPVQFAPSHSDINCRLSDETKFNTYHLRVSTDGTLYWGFYGIYSNVNLQGNTRMDVHLNWMI